MRHYTNKYQRHLFEDEYFDIKYLIRPHTIHYFVVGMRGCGKTFSTISYFLECFFKNGNPFSWIRLTETSANNLLQNNCIKLFDEKLIKKYNLYNKIHRIGNNVFYEDKLLCSVYAAKTFYNDKGSAIYRDYPKEWCYHIGIDEMNLEDSERKDFDIPYCIKNQINTITRNATNAKIFYLGNNTTEISALLSVVNYIPTKPETKYFPHKKTLIAVLPVNKIQKQKNETIKLYKNAATSSFTNYIDYTEHLKLVTNDRRITPRYIIKFDTYDKSRWFTWWSNDIISIYSGQHINLQKTIIMDEKIVSVARYIPEQVQSVKTMFNNRYFRFNNIQSLIFFTKNLFALNNNDKE